MLAITLGEPAGIGLELVAQLEAERKLLDCVLIGDQQMIHQSMPSFPKSQIHHIPLNGRNKLGQLNSENAQYVLNTIEAGVQGCLSGDFQAMITCPIHKGVINDAGVVFSGHTEFLAELTQTNKVVMMLLNPVMRVALVTTHVPLKDVSKHVTFDAVVETCEIVANDLVDKFGINMPKIALCGLNPHAGESGHMGMEEIETIIPAMNHLKSKGLDAHGPYPADTLFTPNKVKGFDAIIAMYHDQGLAPLKYAGFGESVNITLGLPIIRTSVDHGTALDIAGQGLADAGSLKAAITCARECVQKRKRKSQ